MKSRFRQSQSSKGLIWADGSACMLRAGAEARIPTREATRWRRLRLPRASLKNFSLAGSTETTSLCAIPEDQRLEPNPSRPSTSPIAAHDGGHAPRLSLSKWVTRVTRVTRDNLQYLINSARWLASLWPPTRSCGRSPNFNRRPQYSFVACSATTLNATASISVCAMMLIQRLCRQR